MIYAVGIAMTEDLDLMTLLFATHLDLAATSP